MTALAVAVPAGVDCGARADGVGRLSTASVYPESTARRVRDRGPARLRRRRGDGLDRPGQPGRRRRCAGCRDYHEVPILAMHAPCLVITQRVWGTDPWASCCGRRDAAEELGAETVVVHPPFRWQREYARQFVEGIARMAEETDVRFAVENMYPCGPRPARSRLRARLGPRRRGLPDFTLDLSHTSVSAPTRSRWSRDGRPAAPPAHRRRRRAPPRTSTWCPAAATQPCARCSSGSPAAASRATSCSRSTPRKADDRAEREADLAEALAFTRRTSRPRAVAAGRP